DRLRCRGEGLGDHLTAKDGAPPEVLALPSEEVFFNLLERQQLHQLIENVAACRGFRCGGHGGLPELTATSLPHVSAGGALRGAPFHRARERLLGRIELLVD